MSARRNIQAKHRRRKRHRAYDETMRVGPDRPFVGRIGKKVYYDQQEYYRAIGWPVHEVAPGHFAAFQGERDARPDLDKVPPSYIYGKQKEGGVWGAHPPASSGDYGNTVVAITFGQSDWDSWPKEFGRRIGFALVKLDDSK